MTVLEVMTPLYHVPTDGATAVPTGFTDSHRRADQLEQAPLATRRPWASRTGYAWGRAGTPTVRAPARTCRIFSRMSSHLLALSRLEFFIFRQHMTCARTRALAHTLRPDFLEHVIAPPGVTYGGENFSFLVLTCATSRVPS